MEVPLNSISRQRQVVARQGTKAVLRSGMINNVRVEGYGVGVAGKGDAAARNGGACREATRTAKVVMHFRAKAVNFFVWKQTRLVHR